MAFVYLIKTNKMIYLKIYLTIFFVIFSIAIASTWLEENSTNEKIKDLFYKTSIFSWIILILMVIGGGITVIWID